MKLNEILQPFQSVTEQAPGTVGSAIKTWDGKNIPEKTIYLLGVSDLNGFTQNLDTLRAELYKLFKPAFMANTIDLGNLISLSYEDQKEAIELLLKKISQKQSVLLILNENEFSWSSFLNYRTKSNRNDITIVDSHFNPADNQYILQSGLSNTSDEKCHLISTQSYFVDEQLLKEKKKSNLIIVKLGEIRDDIQEAEPEFRDVSKCVFHLRAVRVGDYPSNKTANPNGLYAEELCQLSWFAGNSDMLKYMLYTGLELNPENSKQSALLVAQSIWYFLLGFGARKNEKPSEQSNDFKQYHIENNKIPEDLVIYKSKKSSKYWFRYGKSGRFIPCSPKDMDIVLNNDIPNRLLNYV